MTYLHVAASILLTSLYTFTTIFICIFPWLGQNEIGNLPPSIFCALPSSTDFHLPTRTCAT
jgi:hypothetical protein